VTLENNNTNNDMSRWFPAWEWYVQNFLT
jgi:hypothetical protein